MCALQFIPQGYIILPATFTHSQYTPHMHKDTHTYTFMHTHHSHTPLTLAHTTLTYNTHAHTYMCKPALAHILLQLHKPENLISDCLFNWRSVE
ncbi:hypothetical protein NP493_90g05021 [Ridgeia piscesae]|uniref:Uncharacterized protein n=1 Tax=Ridgeia piscesae TaxID=27915 RepID=A0AAD9P8F7_RIDPI|nr:hypothetical protein NP493_90g05021 [Ridgeia piscesae]